MLSFVIETERTLVHVTIGIWSFTTSGASLEDAESEVASLSDSALLELEGTLSADELLELDAALLAACELDDASPEHPTSKAHTRATDKIAHGIRFLIKHSPLSNLCADSISKNNRYRLLS